jgi:DNA mismatch repair ATPase MutS
MVGPWSGDCRPDTQVVDVSEDVQHNAHLVDELDLALSFAQTAVDLNYVRPKLNNSCVVSARWSAKARDADR